ncbi:helix-turn-helix transcriptional regulator [Thioclava pacifica]|nr:helix-turn-helix transcriptional regulator [Thioclava pacifica]
MKDYVMDRGGDPGQQRAIEAGMIGAVAQWCECLHGTNPLRSALRILTDSIGAEAIVLSRYARAGETPTRVLVHDRARSGCRIPLQQSFAELLLDGYLDKAKPGSTWYGSMRDEELPAAAAMLLARRQLNELVVIPLEVSDRAIDTIELHFTDKLRHYQQAVLTILADTLSRTWSNRARGLFTEALLKSAAAQAAPAVGSPILSADNPARLSRAEYRVCLLLSHGQSPDQMRGELGISESTLRTHLSNLYAKTGARNLAELTFQLVSDLPFELTRRHAGRLA